MTGWDAVLQALPQYLSGGAYSIVLGIISCGFVVFITWKLFKKSIKRWFEEMVTKIVDERLVGVNDRLDRHREEIDRLRKAQQEQDREIAVMKRDHSSLNETLKKTVMPDILRIKSGVDELHRILIKFNKQ